MVNQQWLRKKLKKIKSKKQIKNMEKNIKDFDINVYVSGVAMEGESNINEHNRTSENNKSQFDDKKSGNIRKYGSREND
jgi:hypothetical protein